MVTSNLSILSFMAKLWCFLPYRKKIDAMLSDQAFGNKIYPRCLKGLGHAV